MTQFKQAEVLTFSGGLYNLLEPELSQISILDIAHSLSNLCRFGGHSRVFYSVAQHSVLVSMSVRSDLQFDALLHDAAEALVGDVPKPLKMLLPDYQVIERRVESALFARFGITYPLAGEIKIADKRVLHTELRDLTFNEPANWDELRDFTPLPERIVPLNPIQAKNLFMERFSSLYRPREQAPEIGNYGYTLE
ncbi:metal-dependent phosphohydrolase [Trinickia fusca]|uniref:Metal-dependent phosphohydrolase n=1 Tax=Trinickia fusca TaxID=2419777 RepID=A0A494XD62_9BURK|nr:metal-dependent phosphohydrolase [Trinickia fusca]RKP48438.1 metal-dependent phosphohydrolase [Trinickia fusca]